LLNLSVFVPHLPPKIPAAYSRKPGNGRLNKPGIMRCQGRKPHQKLDATLHSVIRRLNRSYTTTQKFVVRCH